jgi:hypothetical protein
MLHKYLAKQAKYYEDTRMRMPSSKETDFHGKRIQPCHFPTKQTH